MTPEIALPPRPAGVTLSRWLYEAMRRAILDGRLPRGARLPATREFAAQYSVSRRTAVTVFEQLQAEGYVVSRVGAGTRVSTTLPDDLLQVRGAPPRASAASAGHDPHFRRPTRLFRPIEPALNEFPADLWSRVASRRLRRISPSLLAGGGIAGYGPLREAVAAYLGSSRGVICTADQVVIVSGVQQGLDLAARALFQRGDTVWIEDPAYSGTADAFRNAGLRVAPVAVDEQGFNAAAAAGLKSGARGVYVTPAHQFPLGMTLALDRRLSLLAWARKHGALILEDDYDSEFRFAGRPVPALQGLDRSGSVVFAGSFNKVLFPALRLGYLVLPRHLVDPVLKLRFQMDRYPPGLSQAVLCDFINEGHFGRHLRRMRQLYAARLEALQEAAARYLGGLLELPPIQAGLNTPAFLRNGMSGTEAEALLAHHELETTALERFCLQRRDVHGLLLGFAAFHERELTNGVLRLASILGGAASPRAR